MTAKVAALVQPPDPLHTVARLEELLEKAKSGEVVEFLAVVTLSNRNYSIMSSGTRNTLEELGMLFTLMSDIVQNAKS